MIRSVMSITYAVNYSNTMVNWTLSLFTTQNNIPRENMLTSESIIQPHWFSISKLVLGWNKERVGQELMKPNTQEIALYQGQI